MSGPVDQPNEETRPLAHDGRAGCPVIVWDGPYSTRCSAGAAVGRCAHHGEFAPPAPSPAGDQTPPPSSPDASPDSKHQTEKAVALPSAGEAPAGDLSDQEALAVTILHSTQAAVEEMPDFDDEYDELLHLARVVADVVLRSTWLRDRDAARDAEVEERGYLAGYEAGLLAPESSWMRGRKDAARKAWAEGYSWAFDEDFEGVRSLADNPYADDHYPEENA